MPTPDPLAALVQLSNRIGLDPRLVQPGGGNTSVKLDDTLFVKGSGTDLRTIGPDGFARLSLARLAPLAEAESMSDAEMMRFMAGCMLAEGPAPSVETPLHSLLPHRVIAHTHDVATMSLTNVPDATAERLVGELVGHGAVITALNEEAVAAFVAVLMLKKLVGEFETINGRTMLLLRH